MEEKAQNQSGEIVNNQPQPVKSTRNYKWLMITGLVILILAIAGGAYFLGQKTQNTSQSEATPAPTTTSNYSPTPTKIESKEELGLDETYISAQHGWQMDYSSDLKLTKYGPEQIGKNGVGESVLFTFLGKTQGEGTEFHDGISFTVGVKKISTGKTLKEFVAEDSKPDPEIGTQTPLKEIEINSLEGFETTVSSLGTFRLIYLQNPKNSDQAYYLAIFADGPAESKAGYDKIVKGMLESFRNVQ